MRRTFIVTCILALLLASFTPAFAQSEQPIPVIPVLPADQAAVMVQQQSAGSFIYVVQRGDTLASIARRFGTTVQAIAQVNNIYNPNLIFAGQQLIIPTGTPQPPTPPPTVPVFYLVRPGDTLASIARQFGTTWQAIAQANNIQNPNRIYAGMYLIIPTGTPQPPPNPTIIQYVVRPGDTLSSIARQFNTTVSAILQFNNIQNPNRIFWGTVLNIPVW